MRQERGTLGMKRTKPCSDKEKKNLVENKTAAVKKKAVKNAEPYNGDMSGGALMERESRVIAHLLLEDLTDKQYKEKLFHDNILQKRSIKTIQRQELLIRKRLDLLGKEGWKLIDKGSSETVRQILLVACIMNNRLFGDYLLNVVKEHLRLFEKQLNTRAWATFIEEIEHRAPIVSTWSAATKAKLGQVTHKILAEAGIIENTRNKKFLPFFLSPEVAAFLRKRNETYVLKCLELK